MKHLKTFWELISGEYSDSVPTEERDGEFIIDIPIIQRDYAQGRQNEKQRRDLFLQELLYHLDKTSPLHLDFIYGRIKDERQNGKLVFSPIDGQQRLTTLYLLHWYTGLKEKIKEKQPDSFIKLQNFVYDTRLSSRYFCKSLVEKDIVLPRTAEESIETVITSSYWFRDSWKNDPTIKAMLIMLQAIHTFFFDTDGLWHKLTEERIITFHILDMGEKGFELNDQLYIKMNSRGKQLTDFEIFKANFIKFLETEYKDYYIFDNENSNGKLSYSDYFSFRIEKEWTDLFWVYREKNIYTIDKYFMNYLAFISQLLYYMDHSGTNVHADDFNVNNFAQIKEIYSSNKTFFYKDETNKNRIIFLFKSLDLFYNISLIDDKMNKERLNSFFNELFYSSDYENKNNYNMKIFVNNVNQIFLFERCLKNDWQIKDRIILFSIIFYCLKYNLINISDTDYLNIKQCIRVIRNLLHAQRQKNNIAFTADLRINEFSNYWRLINELLEEEIYALLPVKNYNKSTGLFDKQLNEEKKKATLINSSTHEFQNALFILEDFKYFDGLIHVLSIDENKGKIIEYSKAVKEIWSNENPDSLIISAMIASGFNGCFIKYCDYWQAKAIYFGGNNNWDFLLTNDDSEVAKNIVILLDNFINLDNQLSTKEKLHIIISESLNNFSKDNWQFYFLKYPQILDHPNYYYFAFYDDFNVRLLGTDGINPLVALHINAYVRVICNYQNIKDYCKSEYDCSSQYGYKSPLILKKEIKLYCEKEGWKLDIGEMDSEKNTTLQSALKKYNISDTDYILHDYMNLDRIETVIEFIKEINST